MFLTLLGANSQFSLLPGPGTAIYIFFSVGGSDMILNKAIFRNFLCKYHAVFIVNAIYYYAEMIEPLEQDLKPILSTWLSLIIS